MVTFPRSKSLEQISKIYKRRNDAFKQGFSLSDLPKDSMGKTLPSFQTSYRGTDNVNVIKRQADFLLSPAGRKIISDRQQNLREARINDPQRTLTYTVRENGTKQTFREPRELTTVKEEIASNLRATARGIGMFDDSKSQDYGNRQILPSEGQKNTSLTPNINFNRRKIK